MLLIYPMVGAVILILGSILLGVVLTRATVVTLFTAFYVTVDSAAMRDHLVVFAPRSRQAQSGRSPSSSLASGRSSPPSRRSCAEFLTEVAEQA